MYTRGFKTGSIHRADTAKSLHKPFIALIFKINRQVKFVWFDYLRSRQ